MKTFITSTLQNFDNISSCYVEVENRQYSNPDVGICANNVSFMGICAIFPLIN